MNLRSRSSLKTVISLCVFSIGISLVFAPFTPAKGLGLQGEMRSRSGIGLEIHTSGESTPIRLGSPDGGRGMTLILRRSLRITDPNAAGEFTALDVRTEAEGDAIKVTLSIIYNDLSNQEWRKDKKEKFAGSYLIREGEIVRPVELAQFGIEPFEIKAIDARPAKLKPGEGPRITNSPSLRVDRIEKHMDNYVVWLKNISEKNIVSYTVSSGGGSVQTGAGYTNTPVLVPGATSTETRLSGPEADRSGIEIPFVMFDDGSFEGDSKSALHFLAVAQGVKIQAPSVLKMIEHTLKVDDSDLRAAFVTLESELWVIPEALDKPSAIQFLKTKFPAEDEKSLSALYEVFKGGLYDGRNIALSSLGDTLRVVRQHEERGEYASAVESIRRTLEHLKETFARIVLAPR